MPYVFEVAGDEMIVKEGDTRRIKWLLPGFDLTGATAKILVQKGGVTQELAATIDTPPTAGYVSHQLTGLLEVGDYLLEIEVTRGGEIATVPSEGYSKLRVYKDLG